MIIGYKILIFLSILTIIKIIKGQTVLCPDNFYSLCPHIELLKVFAIEKYNSTFNDICSDISSSQCPSLANSCVIKYGASSSYSGFEPAFQAFRYLCTDGKLDFDKYQTCTVNAAYQLQLLKQCFTSSKECSQLIVMYNCAVGLAEIYCNSGAFVNSLTNYLLNIFQPKNICFRPTVADTTLQKSLKQTTASEFQSTTSSVQDRIKWPLLTILLDIVYLISVIL